MLKRRTELVTTAQLKFFCSPRNFRTAFGAFLYDANEQIFVLSQTVFDHFCCFGFLRGSFIYGNVVSAQKKVDTVIARNDS